MQIERQWQLLKCLPDHRNPKSTDDLWRAVKDDDADVSKRTVERDLSYLASIFPIGQKTEGRTNYWYWEQGVKMWLPGLTDDEALAFHMVEQNMRQLLPEGSIERLTPYFSVARTKLAGQPGRIRSRTQKFRLINSGVPRVARKIFNMDASRIIRGALLNDQQICISFWGNSNKNSMETETAIINPLALVQRDSELLLVYSRQGRHDPEFIPLRDIDSATQTLSKFDGPENFDIDAYIESGAMHFEHDLPIRIGDWIQLSASFTKEAWQRLCNTPLAAFERISHNRDSHVRLVIPIRFTANLADWLLSLGPKVCIHQPAALRRWVGARLAAAADQYRGEECNEKAQQSFRWYEKWDKVELTCSHCGWHGSAHSKELEPRGSNDQNDCEFRCPQCSRLLLIIDYAATMDDILRNWDVIDQCTRSAVLSTPERMEQFEQKKLTSPEQLPDLKKGAGFLTWDIVRHESGEISNIVKHGPRMVWIQPALWDGADEFVRVAKILAARYGKAISDIRITPAARMFLSDENVDNHQKIKGALKLFA